MSQYGNYKGSIKGIEPFDRKPGYYWIKLNMVWVIAEFKKTNNGLLWIYNGQAFSAALIEAVDNKPITRDGN